ncbi:MAG: acetate kinase [Phycisphaerales bacterium]|nr:MAG: acetate kinase [Phycisphaerales bacterium]
MKVLVINAGSSSIKYQLYDMPAGQVLAKGSVEKIGDDDSKLTHRCGSQTTTREEAVADHKMAMQRILEILVDKQMGAIAELAEIATVGHRVVHGGEEFTGSMIVDDRVLASIEKFVDLAPLHNPHNLVGIRAAQDKLPDAIQVACFDTAFHTSIPEVAYMYALPYELYEKYRVRRYGFHGTSHRYVARRAATLMDIDKYQFNTITCHLGNGCSMAAVRNGRSIDTSMGFTPLEGLVMGTRTGDFDPAILFYLADKGYDMGQLNTLCNKKSGLLGISGVSNDMRTLEQLAEEGNPRAKLAIEVFSYRVRKYIGAFLTVLNPLHAIVFTGGIGENSPLVRKLICQDLDHLGIRFDAQANETEKAREKTISSADSDVRIMVIPTNEEEAIAGDAFELAAPVAKAT